MSKEQDLLFCKIAISSQRVSQEDAQKCLALANRLESEGMDRPPVGQIFLKKNLLSGDDVKKIYGAVQKRMEAQEAAGMAPALAAGAPRPAAPRSAAARPAAPGHGGTAAKPAHPGRVVRSSHAEPPQTIDQKTLVLGIVFGLIALIGIVVMIIFLLTSQGKKEGTAPPADLPRGIPPAPASTAAPASSTPAVPAAAKKEPPPAKSPEVPRASAEPTPASDARPPAPEEPATAEEEKKKEGDAGAAPAPDAKPADEKPPEEKPAGGSPGKEPESGGGAEEGGKKDEKPAEGDSSGKN